METASQTDMIRINLQDWRQTMREEKRKAFLTALAVAAVASVAFVWLISVFVYGAMIDNQQARNQYLERQIALADAQLVEIRELEATRDNLITRMRIIEQLQQSRAQIVHYFDQIAGTLPEGVYLTALEQNGNTTTIDGVAESNGRVSDYMVNLEDSPHFDDPRLVVIKSSESGPQRFADFTLRVESVNPDAPVGNDMTTDSVATAGSAS